MPAPDDPNASERNSASDNNGSDRSSSGGLSAWTDAVRDMAPYLDLGWRLTAAAAGPPLLGHFCVDLWFGTTPWGILAGAGIGILAAGVQLKRVQHEFSS